MIQGRSIWGISHIPDREWEVHLAKAETPERALRRAH